MSIALGGEKTKIVTYAELVTSIINPSHKFSSFHFAKQKKLYRLIKKSNINIIFKTLYIRL
jgi:predicted cupin superfamily sugar epimerase